MRIVCLCGSTRFKEEFEQVNRSETLAGNIVLAPGVFGWRGDPAVKNGLDYLHFKKIELANEILVINVNGYIGESTAREIDYAVKLNKHVRYLERGD